MTPELSLVIQVICILAACAALAVWVFGWQAALGIAAFIFVVNFLLWWSQ